MRGGGKQIGSCRIEFVTRRVLRVIGGMDDPAVIAALRRAGGAPDDRRRPRVWWVPARRWAGLRCGLKRATDPLFRHAGFDLDDDR